MMAEPLPEKEDYSIVYSQIFPFKKDEKMKKKEK